MKTQITKKLGRALALLAVAGFASAGLMACKGGGGGHHSGGGGGGHSGGGGPIITDPYRPLWYNVYGQQCGMDTPKPGCNFYADGRKIIDTEDPYFSSTNVLYFDTWYYTDSYGYSRTYNGWAWLSDTGILYNDIGRALNQDKEDEDRDMIAGAADEEVKMVESAGLDFSARYALSEEQGIQVAKTLNEWAKLSKNRTRTQADMDEFAKRLYGVSLNQVEESVMKAAQGDRELLNQSIDQMSVAWGITPQTSKIILKDTYGEFMKDFEL